MSSFSGSKKGRHLMEKKDTSILLTWAQSSHLWTKRIAMVTCWWLIRKGDGKGDLDVGFELAEILRHDDHDLIHKAVGWMLREAGTFVLQHSHFNTLTLTL